MEIKISETRKRVKVNDDGAYIVVDIGDQNFIGALLDLIRDFEGLRADFLAKAAEIEGMPKETEGEQIARAVAATEFSRKVCTSMRERVDALFHDNVCEKVFGDILPTPAAFAEFFAQLAALVGKFQMEQNAAVRKYTDKYSSAG